MNFTIATRLNMIVVLTALSLVALGTVSLYAQYQVMFDLRKAQIEALTQSAGAIIADFRDRASRNEISDDAARRMALEAVGAMRFGKGDYIFVFDTAGVALAHPDPKLRGRNLSGLKDRDGFPFIADVLPRAIRDGTATVTYSWNRAGGGAPAPKLSVFRSYAPWGMVFGTGLYIDDLMDIVWSQAAKLLLGAGALTAIVALVIWLIVRSVIRPLASLRVAMNGLAEGRTDLSVPEAALTDEVGAMARAVLVFRDNAIERRHLQGEHEADQARRLNRAGQLEALIAGFQSIAGDAVATITGAAQRLQATATDMTSTASETAGQSMLVSNAADQAASNVRAVAAAAEELGSSVQEIGRQVAGSSDLARNAVDEASRTADLVHALSTAVARIGDVVAMISTIASKTNLLALNATIEAARAGEAGRGFVVVATEVKELATQTAKATDEIASQIAQIKSSTDQAVRAIGGVGARIQQISTVATSIAAAVEQQGVATLEIVRNVTQAAAGTSDVTGGIAGVALAAEATGSAAGQVLGAASELSHQSGHLNQEVARFLSAVRAA
ncbi:methyl-accepting chemotaxis protein [Methylobacterium sp. 174MFSha1.1]|uniref:methyl-accepting chemotaxis protein n=1 Tax=Methylobacterium sp. 174MFSha1.1 TaxID=1502749 RepID=UPI0008F1FE61|nr:methyl-accepting chemotaxis protein [Methylobacterium sp. 174MFSha1.1]SFU66516.1 methyl-accepting chemotaxis protein [Methylobacterium sp. 174MFSha1.1]